MADDGVYCKTEKGRNEVATRAEKLGLRQRAMLIMVDDKTSRGGLLARSAYPGAGDILDALLVEGFIELCAGRGAAAATAVRAGPTPPSGAALEADVKAEVQRIMARYIGPMAEIVCMEHFAQSQDPRVLIDALAAEIPSAERAAQFRAEIATLPGLNAGRQ